MKNKYDITIIGCGTSAGFLLGFLRDLGFPKEKRILVLDKGKEPFRKIYASGNGRCNFSNTDIKMRDYYSSSASGDWKNAVFELIKKLDLRKYFLEKGIPSVFDEYGRLVPFTNSAKTAANFLENNLSSVNAGFKNYAKVTGITKKPSGGYMVRWMSKNGSFSDDSDLVVFSAGGAAYPQLDSDGSGLMILKELGHTIITQLPGIVPLETSESPFHKLAGLKVECEICFKNLFKRRGELLFTKYGISGPNVLYASNIVSLNLKEGHVVIKISFLPGLTLEYFKSVLKNAEKKTIQGVFGGALNRKFLDIFINMMPEGGGRYKGNIDEESVEEIYKALVGFPLSIHKTRSFKEAQVSLGGVKADEIYPFSFESNINKNLYILGESIDYTGGCGGYNIHWCAATAKAAAENIINKFQNKF